MILKIVALGPVHGYGISLRIRQISQEVLQVQQGSLYPARFWRGRFSADPHILGEAVRLGRNLSLPSKPPCLIRPRYSARNSHALSY
jgi:hypothetical protein